MEKMNLHAKLVKIQKVLKAPKNQYNEFGKFKYRNAEGILTAAKPLLAEFDLVMILKDELEEKAGRVFVKAVVEIIDAETCENETATAYAEIDTNHKGMSNDQCTGCASSYARKYALNGMFLLDDMKDADARNNEKNDEDVPADDIMKEKVKAECKRCGMDLVTLKEAIKNVYPNFKLETMTVKEFMYLKAKFDKTPTKEG